jgi:hypothetical protein
MPDLPQDEGASHRGHGGGKQKMQGVFLGVDERNERRQSWCSPASRSVVSPSISLWLFREKPGTIADNAER